MNKVMNLRLQVLMAVAEHCCEVLTSVCGASVLEGNEKLPFIYYKCSTMLSCVQHCLTLVFDGKYELS